jgi:hypothetical protein
MKKYEKVEIKWLDSRRGGNWTTVEHAKTLSVSEVTSIGFLITDNHEKIVLASDIAEKHIGNVTVIPRMSVIDGAHILTRIPITTKA